MPALMIIRSEYGNLFLSRMSNFAMKNSLQMEKNVLLYTCNMLYIFLYQIFNVKKFNQRNLIKLNFQTKPRYIKKRRAYLLLYILVNL